MMLSSSQEKQKVVSVFLPRYQDCTAMLNHFNKQTYLLFWTFYASDSSSFFSICPSTFKLIKLKYLILLSLSCLCWVSAGSWKCHWEAGAHLSCESGPYGHWFGFGSSWLLQRGAGSEYGTCWQGDQYGRAADLQTSQKTGLYYELICRNQRK